MNKNIEEIIYECSKCKGHFTEKQRMETEYDTCPLCGVAFSQIPYEQPGVIASYKRVRPQPSTAKEDKNSPLSEDNVRRIVESEEFKKNYKEEMEKSFGKTEHKSIEELRKEFWNRFSEDDPFANSGIRLMKQIPAKDVLDYFLPHLNSRNLLERFVEKVDTTLPTIVGADIFIDWSVLIDEFIESESGK